MKSNILILYGGSSTEHDVSIITALQIYKNFASEKYNFVLTYISKNGEMFIGKKLDNFASYKNFNNNKITKCCLKLNSSFLYEIKKDKKLIPLFSIDFVINCCHGGAGEDGKLNSILELNKIPSSNGVASSMAISMNKYLTKCFLKSAYIPYINFILVKEKIWLVKQESVINKINKFGYPVVIKPTGQGSSVGVCFVNNDNELKNALQFAFKLDDAVIIEKAIIDKREFNCCLMRTRDEIIASEIEEPKTRNIVIGFKDKYLSGAKGKGVKNCMKTKIADVDSVGMENATREFPAKINEDLKKLITANALLYYKCLDMNGAVRIDFIYDNRSKRLFLSEANANPGSLGYYFWNNERFVENIIDGGKKYWQDKFAKLTDVPIAKIFN